MLKEVQNEEEQLALFEEYLKVKDHQKFHNCDSKPKANHHHHHVESIC